jgi:superfamily II DNA or RNA helicase
VLDWLGLGRRNERCPLIGLTATPFRGINQQETLRLVRRYREYRLDAGIFDGDAYEALQRMRVLSRVRHRILAGTIIDLSDAELAQAGRLHRLPPSVENRLGTDTNRNHILVDSVRSLPDDWTVLLFAASVDHAEIMAGLLSIEGIRSAAISAVTEPGARRHYVEEFRAGRIRVLTNYGVLAQGFDAPAVRAVYVARPTFSPNLYQQMIGRGLRGPRNGGKDECLIVNVQDNLKRFGEELAFKHFEFLWNGEQ